MRRATRRPQRAQFGALLWAPTQPEFRGGAWEQEREGKRERYIALPC